MSHSDLGITPPELLAIFEAKYGPDLSAVGWAPRLRARFGYFSPDDHYEALVSKLVTPGSAWLDVGCGRNIFPSNYRLARTLAERCRVLVGVDPDDTIRENTLLHRRVQQSIEDFKSDEHFDVVTLRMAAEHVTDPDGTVGALSRLTRVGGVVVVYTINRWSPVPIITWLVPFRLHHPAKRVLWQTEAKDTFPVRYRMNTRKDLRRVFGRQGFREAQFAYLDDCRTLARFRVTLSLELCLWRCLRASGVTYPDNCLLGVYERV
jgi:SAM-dependent methyltransferase